MVEREREEGKGEGENGRVAEYTRIYRHIPYIPPDTFIYPHIPSYTFMYFKISNIRNMGANMRPKHGHNSSPRASLRVRI